MRADSVSLGSHYVSRTRPAPAGFVRSLLGSASTSLNPRDRTSGRRARGLSDDLGDYPTISRTRVATGREPHGNCHHTKRRPRGDHGRELGPRRVFRPPRGSGDRRGTRTTHRAGGSAREKVASACFYRPGSVVVRRRMAR